MDIKPDRLITVAELARRVASARSHVYRVCEPKGALGCALVGKKIDLNHKAALAWCATHGYKEPEDTAIRPTKRLDPASVTIPPDGYDDDPDNADGYLDMTLRELATKYGRQPQFKEYVAAAHKLIQMRGLEEEQARKRGEYIHRVHAERLIALIDGLQKTLLSDTVTNIASTVTAQIKSGADRKEVEASMRETISRVIKTNKGQAVRTLRNA